MRVHQGLGSCIRPRAAAEEPEPLEGRMRRAFAEDFGGTARLLVRAPGRVNLLGEHTDYNEGFVLPMAIDRGLWIALRGRPDRQVALRSLDFGDLRRFHLDDLQHQQGSWIEYVLGTAWALGEAGLHLRGWEGVVAGEIPMGAGLASSAALEIASIRAFAAVSGLEWEPAAAARWAQRAENRWVGVSCGIMDQLIVAAGREGHALLIDCRDLSTAPCPLPPATVVVVLDTTTRRRLGESPYNERRAGCEEAARRLGLRSLRDLSPAELERRQGELPEAHRGLARHVVSENGRTLAAAEAMRAGDAARLGELMAQGHHSLREDFGVCTPELDAMALSASQAPGCFGARMTGAGFGGCVVALVDAGLALEFAGRVRGAYRERTGLEPSLYACRPDAGASVRCLG